MRALKFLIPLLVFGAIAWFLFQGLSRDPRQIPSPLIGKPAPAVSLPLLADAQAAPWTTEQMRGQVWLLNVWGTWCAGCKVEHPVLNEMARQKLAPIVGMAWRDNREAAQQWLKSFGDPYAVNVMDNTGKAAIDWGVYGAPETFVIDKKGVVRDKVIGIVTREILATRLAPLISKLQAE